MRRLTILFLFISGLSTLTNANIWDNLQKERAQIDVEKVFESNDYFQSLTHSSDSSTIVQLIDTHLKTRTASLYFHFDNQNVCNQIILDFNCSDCYHSNLKEIKKTSLPKGTVVKKFSKSVKGEKRYYIMLLTPEYLASHPSLNSQNGSM